MTQPLDPRAAYSPRSARPRRGASPRLLPLHFVSRGAIGAVGAAELRNLIIHHDSRPDMAPAARAEGPGRAKHFDLNRPVATPLTPRLRIDRVGFEDLGPGSRRSNGP